MHDAQNVEHLTQAHASSKIFSTQNYLFFTQTDVDYYNLNINPHTNQIGSTNSQYMKVNSILDALENTGYYGFVTFIGTVQRIGLLKWFLSSQASFGLTQKTQTQSTQSDHFKLVDFKTEKSFSSIND